jgi:hypothetical protein
MKTPTIEEENRNYGRVIGILSLLGAIASVSLTTMPVGAGFGDYVIIALIGAVLGPASFAVLGLFFGLISI